MTGQPSSFGARPITGRMVLIGVVAFFAVITLVNGIFMYFALSSWPGLSRQDAYQDGLKYNRVIEEGRRQAALGWHSEVELDRAGLLRVRMVTATGAPVDGLTVTAKLMRPLGADEVASVPLVAGRGGVYRANVPAPPAGAWIVDIGASGAGGAHYRMTHEIWIAQ